MNQYSTNEMTAAGQRRITVVGVDLGKTWIEVCVRMRRARYV